MAALISALAQFASGLITAGLPVLVDVASQVFKVAGPIIKTILQALGFS